MNIILLGSGNVATVLGKLLLEKGYQILQVYSRSISGASVLAEQLSAEATSSWNGIRQDGDLYLVALSDKALLELPAHFAVNGKPVAHTAGAVPKRVLGGVSSHYGVFYPLQSLRKELPVTSEIPILIDANDQHVKYMLLELAKSISASVYEADDEQRLHLHIASVFINNFGNHLYALAESFCLKENISFGWLKPLISETANRVRDISPASLRTGPAARGDIETIEKHLKVLHGHPELESVYREMTRSIRTVIGSRKP